MRLTLLFVFIVLATAKSWAQSSADWWYFGNKAGIHFTGGGPVADTNSSMKVIEGNATIADEFGNLLFYTDGDTVWNSAHDTMPNGTGLGGNGIAGSGAQSAWILKHPGSASDYFIFSIRSYFGGLFYSRVNMNLDGGLGDVVTTEKQVALMDTTPEVMTAVRAANGIDFWMITFRKETDTLYAFLVDENGVNPTAVKSATGLFLDSNERVGYLRGSQQNDKLALVLPFNNLDQDAYDRIHLFNFDNVTGQASYDLAIFPDINDTTNYGVEFSPDGTKLYVQSVFQADLRQYDLSSGVSATISASETLVGAGYTVTGGGAIQLGPDGRIYCARNAELWLAAVLFPNQLGGACGYVHDGVSLEGRNSIYGLPQFIPFSIAGGASLEPACVGDTVFVSSYYATADSVKWNFGDPNSGSANTSSSVNAAHVYADSGTYTITIIAYNAFLTDTQTLSVLVRPYPTISLPADTTFCQGDTFTASVSQPYAAFEWNSGNASSSVKIWKDTSLSVTVFGACDTISQAMQVDVIDSLMLDTVPHTALCNAGNAVLKLPVPDGYSILWSTGSVADSVIVNNTGQYWVLVNGLCGLFTDTAYVSLQNSPVATLPADTVICTGQAITIARPPAVLGTTYLWMTGSQTSKIELDTNAVVWLTATNACGADTDTMTVVYGAVLSASLGADTVICPGDSFLLDAGWNGDSVASFIWNTGDTTDTVWATQGDFNYGVTITDGLCSITPSRGVQQSSTVCEELSCTLIYDNVLTPNADGLNDIFRPRTTCDVSDYKLNIYNRWGQSVFRSNAVGIGWDGTVAGEPAAEGTYYFEVDFNDRVVVDEDRNNYRGIIHLLR